MDHIVRHYFVSHGDINPKRIFAVGPDLDFTEPHDRDRFETDLPPALATDD